MAAEEVGILRTILQLDRSDLARELKLAGSDADAFKAKMGAAMADVEKALGRPERAVKRLEAAMRGDRLLSYASTLTEVISKNTQNGKAIGLTDAEMNRHNATLQKAIDKYKVLGQEAPKAMIAAEKATRQEAAAMDLLAQGMSKAGQQASASGRLIAGMSAAGRDAAVKNAAIAESSTIATRGMSLLTGSVGTFAAGFGIAAVVGAGVREIVSLGREAVESAGKLSDMSAKTGLSAETLQRLEFVAGQAGGSLDDFTNASFRLGVRLTSGSQGVNRAVEQLGLNLTSLKRERPDQQLMLVVDALGKVANEQERNRLGVELFGKSYANIASAVAQNMSDIAKSARVMTNEQVAALDALGDKWDKWVADRKASVKGFLGEIVVAMERTAKLKALEDKISPAQMAEIRGRSIRGEIADIDATLALAAAGGGKDVQLAAPAVQPSAIQRLKELDAQVAKLTASQRAEIDAAVQLGVRHEELEDTYGLTAGAIERYVSTSKTAIKTDHDAARAADQHADAVKRVMDAFTGQKEKEQASLAVEGLGLSGFTDPNARLTTTALDTLKGAPREKLQQMAETLQDGIKAWQEAHEQIPPAVTAVMTALKQIGIVPKEMISATLAGVKALEGLDVTPGGAVQMQTASQQAAIELQLSQSNAAAQKAGIFNALDVSSVTGGMVDEFGNVSESIESVIKKQYDLADAAEKASKVNVKGYRGMRDAVGELSQALSSFAGQTDSAFGRLMNDLAQFTHALDVGMSGAALTQAGFAQFQKGDQFGGAVNMAAGGMEVASGFMAATESGSDAARIGKGAIYGAKIGSQYAGGAGAVVGLAAGAIGGAIRATGPSKEEKEARAAYADWKNHVIANFEEVATAQQKLEAGGEDWKKVNISIEETYLKTGRTAKEAMRDLARLNQATAVSAEAVAAALQPISQAIQDQTDDQTRLNAAMDKYGISLREAGEAFQQKTLNTEAKDLIEDWRVLADSGMDVAVINDHMATSMNAYLNDAIATGTAIPSIMKPILDSMAAQGVLFDENGGKLDELAVNGLNFKDIFTDGLDKIALKLDQVVDRLIQVGSLMTGIDLSTLDAANASVASKTPDRTYRVLNPLTRLYTDDLGTTYRKTDGQYVTRQSNQETSGPFASAPHAALGMFIRGTGPVPIVAHGQEGVLNPYATKMVGGEQGINALNRGDLGRTIGMLGGFSMPSSAFSNAGWMMPHATIADPMASVYAAADAVSKPFSSPALSAQPVVNAAMLAAQAGGGDTSVVLQFGPGSVVVQESKDPRNTPQRVAEGLKSAIEHNTGGIRSALVKHVGKPAVQQTRGR